MEIATDLRDSAEVVRDPAFYEKYLAIFIPALVTLLEDEKTVSFLKDSQDQVSRLFVNKSILNPSKPPALP